MNWSFVVKVIFEYIYLAEKIYQLIVFYINILHDWNIEVEGIILVKSTFHLKYPGI